MTFAFPSLPSASQLVKHLPVSPEGPPVRPRTWRPNNPDPRTDYGEMQEDDEEFLLGSNSSKDLSIINLDSSSSENLFFYNSSLEPDDDW